MIPSYFDRTPAALVLAARQMMRRGYGMKEAASALNIIPSSTLDKWLWDHIATDDEDLAGSIIKRPEAMF